MSVWKRYHFIFILCVDSILVAESCIQILVLQLKHAASYYKVVIKYTARTPSVHKQTESSWINKSDFTAVKYYQKTVQSSALSKLWEENQTNAPTAKMGRFPIDNAWLMAS